ncbi:hypothetical protein HPB48_007988 [Haemaphysalis longicornis]|uniref:Endonuclease/exonuclease/phosphatase domain-containing protein n=1 Tax=Haemaphysalis longicornis TaxID=44386 RepID=A0A9J6GRM9_HAELO|nr:hypothetical protein HPB48_007988 [Haemaphysalis longicornis]
MIKVLPLRRRDPPIHVLNIYSPPFKPRITFGEVFYGVLKSADKAPLVIVGDFNAPSRHWGYHFEQARGRKLAELTSTLRLTLLTDPACPTRMGNSVTRDTCPDLSLVRNSRDAPWENLEGTLSSDRSLLRIILLAKAARRMWGQAKLTNWYQFRLQDVPPVLLTDSYTEWAKQINALQQQHVTILQTTEKNPTAYHLMHIWLAHRSITKRWKK